MNFHFSFVGGPLVAATDAENKSLVGIVSWTPDGVSILLNLN